MNTKSINKKLENMTGTQLKNILEKLEIELQNFFKNAKICRVDSDTVKDKDAYDRIYNDFLSHKTDILLGISDKCRLWKERLSIELLSCSIKENLKGSLESVIRPID